MGSSGFTRALHFNLKAHGKNSYCLHETIVGLAPACIRFSIFEIAENGKVFFYGHALSITGFLFLITVEIRSSMLRCLF